jgi:hypothetical protein
VLSLRVSRGCLARACPTCEALAGESCRTPAVLALWPAGVVLGERVRRVQEAGIVAALAGVVMIAAG